MPTHFDPQAGRRWHRPVLGEQVVSPQAGVAARPASRPSAQRADKYHAGFSLSTQGVLRCAVPIHGGSHCNWSALGIRTGGGRGPCQGSEEFPRAGVAEDFASPIEEVFWMTRPAFRPTAGQPGCMVGAFCRLYFTYWRRHRHYKRWHFRLSNLTAASVGYQGAN